MKNIYFALSAALCILTLGGCGKSESNSSGAGSIAAECVDAKIHASSLNRNGYTYDDPPIQALISNGNFSIQKVVLEQSKTGGKPVCQVYAIVEGVHNGNSYRKAVTIWAH